MPVTLFPSGSLAVQRSITEANLPDTCEVLASAVVDDDEGGSTLTWAVEATHDCRIAPAGATAQERRLAEQVTERRAYTVVFAAGTEIDADRRLHVTGTRAGVAFDLTLKVEGSATPRSYESMAKYLATPVVG